MELSISVGEQFNWKRVEFDLGAYRGKRVELRLENWPTGWLNEFSFWSELKIE